LAGAASASDKWQLLTTPAPTPYLDVMLLMPDGSVMMLSANDNQTWVKLSPDAYGSYVNGTWSTVGPMNIPRLYFASQVLQDGRVWVTGGEYTGPYYDSNIAGSGEIYNPATNTWTWTANYPICQPGPRTVNVTSDVVLSAGSPVVTGIYSTDRIQPGWSVTGGGIPAGTQVVSVDSAKQVTISNNATASGPSTVRFRGRTSTCVGDEPSALLPGGNILVGSIFTPTPYIYSLATNTYRPAATKVNSDRSDEEGWAVLDDGRVLNYDLFASVSKNNGYAELYDPVANAWTDISPANGVARGTLPVLTSAALGFELGPPLRLLDGRIMVVGANQHTALYTPSSNTWAPGPDMIAPLSNAFGTLTANYGADDAPAAALPNGHLIIGTDAGPNPVVLAGTTTAGSPVVTGIPSTAGLQAYWGVSGTGIARGSQIASVDSANQVTLTFNATASGTANITYGGVFSSPMVLFDFDPNTGTMTPMNAPDPNLPYIPAFITRMLVLPTGQLLFNDSSNQPWVYTPDGAPPDSARPVISSVTANGDGSYTLAGTQLNGQSAGAAYGDDAQMNENYPIVRLQTAMPHDAICDPNAHNCRVYYARTSNWSSVAVGGGSTPQTVKFTLPAGIPSGKYKLTVTGAGVSSTPVQFDVP
ncbi:MAG TPA: kelch repeat-containing protein, partial [Terriglobales bacterium]|nr:kelch repeat-containing protein [Terriglobales bacterium]